MLQNDIETLKVLNILKSAFPYFERDKSPEQLRDTFKVYLELLDDMDPDLLKRAALQFISDNKYFPAISELRDRVHTIEQQAHRSIGDAQPTAAEAWQQLAQALHPSGYGFAWDVDRKVRLQPIVIKTAELFGEYRFAVRMEDDAGTDFAQFRGIYDVLQKRAEEESKMLPGTRDMIKKLADKLNMGKRLLNGGDHAPKQD